MNENWREVKTAQKHFTTALPGRFKDRKWALDRIAQDKRPMKEAERLIDWFRQKKVGIVSDTPTLSDIVALMRTIVARDTMIDAPQYSMICKFAEAVDQGIDAKEYKRRAAIILAMECAVPEWARVPGSISTYPYTLKYPRNAKPKMIQYKGEYYGPNRFWGPVPDQRPAPQKPYDSGRYLPLADGSVWDNETDMVAEQWQEGEFAMIAPNGETIINATNDKAA